MKVITIEDKIWLNEIAKIHEHLISENESIIKLPQRLSL